MEEQIKQIADRLIGLREVLEITPQQMADVCEISVDDYLLLESGTMDFSVSLLQKVAQAYDLELTTLLFGFEPVMNSYFVTRKGKGVTVERLKAYKYQSLAAGFSKRKVDPFLVTVHPKTEDEPLSFNTHQGEEYIYMISGRMQIFIGKKELVLNEGDSLYFNSSFPHCMRALDGQKVEFLTIII